MGRKRGAMMKAVIIKDGRELFNAYGDTLAKLIINLIEINEDRKGSNDGVMSFKMLGRSCG